MFFLDPCSDIMCNYPQVCRLNFDRNASCVCSTKECSNRFEPVCANNGNTYLNECFLDLEICYANRSLHVIHSNDCSTSINSKIILWLNTQKKTLITVFEVRNPCANKDCKNPGSYCHIDKYGNANCQCENKCESVWIDFFKNIRL
jgi:hypothetical protein